MKKNIVISFFVCLHLVACVKDYSTLTEFVVKNESSKYVKIKVSKFETKFYSTIDTVFYINPNSELKYSYEIDGENALYPYPFGIVADSATILVNDTVCVLFTRDTQKDKNILSIDYYTGGQVKDGLYRFIYIITNEDLTKTE